MPERSPPDANEHSPVELLLIHDIRHRSRLHRLVVPRSSTVRSPSPLGGPWWEISPHTKDPSTLCRWHCDSTRAARAYGYPQCLERTQKLPITWRRRDRHSTGSTATSGLPTLTAGSDAPGHLLAQSSDLWQQFVDERVWANVPAVSCTSRSRRFRLGTSAQSGQDRPASRNQPRVLARSLLPANQNNRPCCGGSSQSP